MTGNLGKDAQDISEEFWALKDVNFEIKQGDRIDTLVGIFGLGIIPTGSSDPFALRRAATGVVQIVWDNNFALNLPKLLQAEIAIYSDKNLLTCPAQTVLENLNKWFKQRYETILADRGIEYDLVNAISGNEDIKAIAPVLARFFDEVLVMAEDPQVRQNRLNLLGIIRNYSRQLADFSAILK